jgi:hypothetical protein
MQGSPVTHPTAKKIDGLKIEPGPFMGCSGHEKREQSPVIERVQSDIEALIQERDQMIEAHLKIRDELNAKSKSLQSQD